MKLSKKHLKHIIEEAWRLENGLAPEDKGVEGDANALLVLYLRGELDEQELQYLREDFLSGEVDVDSIITIFERLISILTPIAER